MASPGAVGAVHLSIICPLFRILSMTNHPDRVSGWLSIADVERDTGLAKDTLRVWERRYGFPQPVRDAQGERRYTDEDLTRLRHVRRLIDAGHRPGRVVGMPLPDLLELGTRELARRIQGPPPPIDADEPDWLGMLHRQDVAGLRQALDLRWRTVGLSRTVIETVAPLTVRVGQAWLDGNLAVFEEHLFTEAVQQVLRQAIAHTEASRRPAPPRVLLTTVPGEVHGLGLLMAECLLVLEGCETVPLGVQTPVPDIVRAAEAGRADVVALSFSAMQSPRDTQAVLQRLRTQLPDSVQIWAGGQCSAVARKPRGQTRVHWPLPRLQDIPVAVARWRAESAPVAA
jgi:MerR family transcriptional regulator, light-induced transcriptional regulator